MTKSPASPASDTLNAPWFVASDGGDLDVAACELQVEPDRGLTLDAAEVLQRWAEDIGDGRTSELRSSSVIVEEPWQRAERQQELFSNGP